MHNSRINWEIFVITDQFRPDKIIYMMLPAYNNAWVNHGMMHHYKTWKVLTLHYVRYYRQSKADIEGILPKGPYPPCLRMADRALLAGYPRYHGYTIRQEVIGLFPKRCGTTACTISLSLLCRYFNTYIDYTQYIDGLVQDFSISSVLAMEILQSCTKPLIYILHTRKSGSILKWES